MSAAQKSALQETIRAQKSLAGISDADIDLLLVQAREERFDLDSILVAQGDDSDHAVLVMEGQVRVAVESEYGIVTVARLQAPCLIGEIAALARLPRTATVRAETSVTTLRVERDLLLDIASRTPGIMQHVVHELGNRIRHVNGAISLYTHALSALESQSFDARILEDLRNPVADLATFGQTFSRMAEQIILRRQREDEMASAALIQRALLPNPADVAAFKGADICASMTPAREVGGDFYDFLELPDGRVVIGVGDVCGKGMPAALFMGIAKTLIRINVKSGVDLGAAITRANDEIVSENTAELFATIFYASFDPHAGALTYVSCGHNPPYIRRANGTVEALPAGGMPIGVFGGITAKLQHEVLSPGDMLFLFTDGVTEAFSPEKEEFGETRLTEALKRPGAHSAKGWMSQVLAAVEDFAAGADQSDDVTCMALLAPERTEERMP